MITWEINAPPKTKKPDCTLRKVDFQKLVNRYSGYNLDFQMDVFQWMIKTSWDFRVDRSGVFEWLYGFSGIGSLESGRGSDDYGFSGNDYRFEFIQDKLRFAFWGAVCDTNCPRSVWEWRKKERVKAGGYRMIPQSKISREVSVSDLFAYTRLPLTLTTQLNEFHPDANKIKSILMTPNQEGWKAILDYGYEKDESGWKYDLTGYGFCSVIAKEAIEKIRKLTGGIA